MTLERAIENGEKLNESAAELELEAEVQRRMARWESEDQRETFELRR